MIHHRLRHRSPLFSSSSKGPRRAEPARARLWREAGARPAVEKQYTFQTVDGARTLAELFDGRSQLVVYHFMFGPESEAGCPGCSSIADSFNGALAHLGARDVTVICISRAPLGKLLAYRERMGWRFNWVSSYESDFNWDYEHSSTRDQVSAWADQVPP